MTRPLPPPKSGFVPGPGSPKNISGPRLDRIVAGDLTAFSSDMELIRFASYNPMWRIDSGIFYKIMVKSADDFEGNMVVPFKPNAMQRHFLCDVWHRNIILKARQLGFSTLISIIWLDHALWVENQRCGIIAHDRESAEAIFRDKVKFAYDNLPPEMKKYFPLARDSASELLFKHNNSSIRVATSMRSGTIHRLHISEFGKICAKYPDKAQEVITGSIPAVPKDGLIMVESTAEGQAGAFYNMTMKAKELDDIGRRHDLTPREYRFHFYPWWQNPEYTLKDDNIIIGPADQKYFDDLEAGESVQLTDEQKRWYVATRDADYGESPELMWQEFPSSSMEAFQQSVEGCYYSKQLLDARRQGRITKVPTLNAPVNTFWDIGKRDLTAIWFHQMTSMEHRFIRYYEVAEEDLLHMVRYLQDTDYLFGAHYLPHDAFHERLNEGNRSVADMLRKLGLRNIQKVPRIDNVLTGIQQTRDVFPLCWFDEEGCKDGLVRLQQYRKRWNKQLGCWSQEPLHDEASNGCLVAGTLVSTERGEIPVETVVPGDRVILGSGYGDVVNAGLVKYSPTLVLEFDDGTRIECSPEHKFFTTTGLSTADALRYNDSVFTADAEIDKWLQSGNGLRAGFTESFSVGGTGCGRSAGSTLLRRAVSDSCIGTYGSTIMAKFLMDTWSSLSETAMISLSKIGSVFRDLLLPLISPNNRSTLLLSSEVDGFTETQITGTTSTRSARPMRACYSIEKCGFPPAEVSQTDTIFITEMVTRATTLWRTWSASVLRSTAHCTLRQACGSVVKPTGSNWLQFDIRRLIGTGQMMVGLGTGNMGRNAGRTDKRSRSRVSSAEPPTRHPTQHAVNSAPRSAVRLVAITRGETLKPVYDLTVKDHHAYLANGLLVSNSDAFRQFGQVYAVSRLHTHAPRSSRKTQSRSWKVA